MLPIPNVWGFFSPTKRFSNSLRQVGSPQFISIPTLSTWRQRQIPQLKDSVPRDRPPPTPDANPKSRLMTGHTSRVL